MTEQRTGRALQLEGLQFAQNKVTLAKAILVPASHLKPNVTLF